MNSSLKNAILMLAPIGILGATAFLLKNRKPAVFTVAGPFQTFVSHARAIPILPGEVQDGYDTKIEVELGARGAAPMWWQKGFGGYSSQESGQLVARRGEKLKILGAPYRSTPHLDSKTKKWRAIYLLKLAPLDAKSGEIRLRDRLQIENNSSKKVGKPLWFDVLVRKNGAKTSIPAVSRDPKLVLERWVLDEAAPVENFVPTGISNSAKWRLKLWFRKRGPLFDENGGVGDNLDVQDARGTKFQFWGNTTWGNVDEDAQMSVGADLASPSNSTDERRSFITHDFTYDAPNAAPKPPLWIVGEASWNKNWPLWVKIPFADKNGKILFSPRPPAPFKVVSVKSGVASAFDKKENGADTTVEILVQPTIKAKVWRWNGHFSQHVLDSKGKKYWEFAFKGGKQAVWPNFESLANGQIKVKYPLVLKTIPASAGTLKFHAHISANGSARVPIEVVVRSATSLLNSQNQLIK